MSFDFNADEIFEMAEQLERNGGKFYRKAAGQVGEGKTSDLLNGLAAMEDQHLKLFVDMRAKLTEEEKSFTTFDPNNEGALYLRAMADGHVFNVNDHAAERLTGEETAEEILKMAIGFEKDAIVFFVGLRDKVPERFGKGNVDKLVKEEVGHVVLLSKELRALK